MRNKILIIGALAFAAYVLGSRATKVQVKKRESVGHQVVRLWNDPKAKKERRKTAEKAAKKAKKAVEQARKNLGR